VNKGRLTLGGLVSMAALGTAVLAAAPAMAQTNGVAAPIHVTAVSVRQASAQPSLQGWIPWQCICEYFEHEHMYGNGANQQPGDNYAPSAADNNAPSAADNNAPPADNNAPPADNNAPPAGNNAPPADNNAQQPGLLNGLLGGLLGNLTGG
jgi:hypothetical protein